jgi:hypothetical protein
LRLVQKTGRALNRNIGLSPRDDDNSTLPVLTVIHKFTFSKKKKEAKKKI